MTMSVRRICSLLQVGFFLVLQFSPPSNAHSSRNCIFLDIGRGGNGAGGDDRRERFETLLRQAQVDPDVLKNEDNALSAMGRVLASPGPLPDLMTVCTMAAVYQSDIFQGGMEAGKETYMAMKVNFAKEFEKAMEMGGITVPDEQLQDEAARTALMIKSCVQYLGSDYLNASFFSIENFRQQVLKNPFWQGLVKASLITHLGEGCPNFDEIIHDGDLWNKALMSC